MVDLEEALREVITNIKDYLIDSHDDIDPQKIAVFEKEKVIDNKTGTTLKVGSNCATLFHFHEII